MALKVKYMRPDAEMLGQVLLDGNMICESGATKNWDGSFARLSGLANLIRLMFPRLAPGAIFLSPLTRAVKRLCKMGRPQLAAWFGVGRNIHTKSARSTGDLHWGVGDVGKRTLIEANVSCFPACSTWRATI